MSFSDPFYTSDYFEFMGEILDFESEDPAEHQRGLEALCQVAEQGNVDAMLVLGRHYLRGRYRDAYLALKWHLEAMGHGEMLGYDMLLRQYAHPDGPDMEAAVRRMEAEGYTTDVLKKMWRAG